MHSGESFVDFDFRGSGRSNLHTKKIAHILCRCTHQYQCDDVLDGFWGPGDGCRSDTGSKTVPNFHKYSFVRSSWDSFANLENKYLNGSQC